ncbi:hypothetical protein TFLX_04430 [Thermoflexales bacterium]|jgi:hypothetical protein|nr:hypothetical protein TFLX_04430 [Thermoflexales bacterium]
MTHVIRGGRISWYDEARIRERGLIMAIESQLARCVNCERTVDEVPLLNLTQRHGVAYICPQCLPILIHKPQQLQNKLPGTEALQPHEH